MAKTLPILWLPLVAAFFIQQRRWLSLALTVVVSLGIVGFLTVTFLSTPEAWASLLNPGVEKYRAGSFHKILETYLNYFPDLPNQLKLELLSKFKLITYAIFGIYYLVVLVQISLQRRYSAESLGLDIGWMSSTLLILATPWLMPWYASILLPVTALNIEDRRFVFTSLAFCLSSTGYYVLISTGVLQSWFVVGLPFLVLGVEMIMPRSKKYVT